MLSYLLANNSSGFQILDASTSMLLMPLKLLGFHSIRMSPHHCTSQKTVRVIWKRL